MILIRSIVVLMFVSLFFVSCNEKQTDTKQDGPTGEFLWSESIKISDIPNQELKGLLNGRPIDFEYINFEQWRGSGDNVFNFGNIIPRQNCGYVENDEAFQIIRKGAEFQEGELIKESFAKSLDGFIADYHYFDGIDQITNVRVDWNLALVIEEMTENRVKGRIAMCFNDEAKSWIAGNFEAIRCYN